jgi:hypothetical protein
MRILCLCLLLLACSSSDGKPHPRDAGGDGDEDLDASPEDRHDAGPTEEPAGQMRTLPLFDAVRISSIDTDEHFQKAEAELDFGAGPFAKVTLFVDLDTSCFPFSRWSEDPPPMGQNFPPSCDAFDRNFEFTLDEPKADTDPPAFEVMRAITPFGGPLHVEVDLTNLANARPGKHRMQAFIATWSDAAGMVSGSHGGWNVSAHVELTTGVPPLKVLAATPLFNTNLGDSTLAAMNTFTLPEGTKQILIELRSTGHGGATDAACFGPAEEFCSRSHSLKIDGKNVSTFDITRTDCGSLCTLVTEGELMYCMQNPTGLPDSVRAPRAGWCPGSFTEPRTWMLNAGGTHEHTLEYAVDKIAMGGSVRASAVLYAVGE